MIGYKAATLVKGNVVCRNIAIAAKELRVFRDGIKIQQRKHAVPAIAAARCKNAIDALIRKRSVDVCRAQRIRARKIPARRTCAFIYHGLKSQLAKRLHTC